MIDSQEYASPVFSPFGGWVDLGRRSRPPKSLRSLRSLWQIPPRPALMSVAFTWA